MAQLRTLYPEGTFYKGNLHTHTTCSDGVCSPQQMAEHYRGHGYSFLAITDHWVYGDHAGLNREDFLVYPGVEFDIELPGRKDHHIVGVGLPEKNRIPHGYTFEQERQGNTLSTAERIIEYLGQRGNIAIYAHPYWSKVDSTDIKNLHGLAGMEIMNYASEMMGANGNSETYFDHFLFVRNRVFCMAADDAHSDDLLQSCGGYLQVKAAEFSHEGILRAIREGSFYASMGPEIRDFYVEDGVARLTCAPAERIFFKTPHTGRVFFPEGEGGLTEAAFQLEGDEEYVRAVVWGEGRKSAWTQPIWLWL